MSALAPRARVEAILEMASLSLARSDLKSVRAYGLLATPLALLDIADAIRETRKENTVTVDMSVDAEAVAEAVQDVLNSHATSASQDRYRVGEKYGIHVYEGNRPVATFANQDEAARFVNAMNRSQS